MTSACSLWLSCTIHLFLGPTQGLPRSKFQHGGGLAAELPVLKHRVLAAEQKEQTMAMGLDQFHAQLYTVSCGILLLIFHGQGEALTGAEQQGLWSSLLN